ncbi:MAG: hypothetical protein GC200_04340 [Tepidisphaera sp.]|nr:hypothetical protein [Tepidisphaera sp.]
MPNISLASLWLPILVSTVLVFVASSIIWMASPLHKHDYKDPGDKEAPLLEFLRQHAFEPGVYYVPWATHKEMKNPETGEKFKRGPWAMLNVFPGMPNMGRNLSLWFVHILIVTTLAAYIGANTLIAGAAYLKVFQIVGTAAILAHAGYALPLCIWHGQPWSQLPGRVIDGLIYGLLTAGVFGWLWPHAPALLPHLN